MNQKIIQIQTSNGLQPVTEILSHFVEEHSFQKGILHVFCMHTSCSLLINESYDDSVCIDLENWLNRLVPENDSLYTHTYEGVDDMPAHVKVALTQTNIQIPIRDSKLCLGTWQGVFLWEHRKQTKKRTLVLTFLSC